MIPRYRAWHKTWKELGKVGKIGFDDKEDVSTVLFKGKFIFENLPKNEVILMQSTGLVDKNGKEIFEGDIVKSSGLLGTIESFKAMWICSFVKYNNYQKVGFFAQEIEVVGNIYENPELLEDK